MADMSTPSPSQPTDTDSISFPENLPDILNTERRRFLVMGPRYAIHAERLGELEKRLSSGRFHLAVLGQVKRGIKKSESEDPDRDNPVSEKAPGDQNGIDALQIIGGGIAFLVLVWLFLHNILQVI
jgi:hypothetical protein